MNFIKLKIRQSVEGNPGFMEAEEVEININPHFITLFHGDADDDVTFIRLSCGATLCVVMPYEKFQRMLCKYTAKHKVRRTR